VFVSIVIPLSDDADILEDVVNDVESILKAHYQHYEMIFVDDGSRDHTRSVMEQRRETVSCLRYFRLSRRFGLEVAIECGLDHAIGDVVVVLRPECDPPALIPAFVEQAQVYETCLRHVPRSTGSRTTCTIGSASCCSNDHRSTARRTS
jgi:hypothetical protein